MGSRGFPAKRTVSQDVILNGIPEPPAALGQDSVALEAWNAYTLLISKHGPITEAMIPQIITLCKLESLKSKAETLFLSDGLVTIDGKGRHSQHPAVSIYLSCIKQIRYILRDLGLTSPVEGKEKEKSKFAVFLEQ